MTTDSSITIHKDGGFTLAGADAVNLYRAAVLASSLKLFAKTGMIPTRGVTGSKMLAMATQYTGKKYKRGEHMKASEDITVWVREMRDALPTEDRREGAGS
jgi:hypothetical protein